MDIIIISQYLRDITNFEDNNSRFVYLAKMLVNNPDNKVEIVTSDFEHSKKKHFKKIGDLPNVKISVLHESGYSKNISLKRFVSHKELAKNIKKYLEHRKKPDVCYCAIPSLDVGNAVAQYCKSYGVRFIIDIQDLWPEAFKMVFNIPVISNILFAPMKRMADNIYSCADEVVAVSKTYAERAMAVNNKCKESTVVYLGTEKESFDRYAQLIEEKRDFLTIVYVGSMSVSYDLVSVIDAISQINSREKIKFLAMGDGALRKKFIEYAKEKNVIAEFPGRLPYPQMIQQLNLCDIAVNPIHKGSAGSIINKVGDYAMAGLPVVNTQECEEYRELLDEYEAGINCECEDANQIALALQRLIEDIDLRKAMSINSRKLGLDCFDRKNSYNAIVNELAKCGGGKLIRLVYCGTLGHSYDITCIIDAIKKLDKNYQKKIQFIVMGDGPKKREFQEQSQNIPVVYTGRIPYPEMVWILSRCDIAVNPISKGAAQSIINKHMDYAMAGLPVISTQENLEYRKLLDEYKAGISCKCEDSNEVCNAMKMLIDDTDLRKTIGKNSLNLAIEKFDRKQSYVKLYELF